MNELITIFGGYLIYVSVVYAVVTLFWKHDRKHFFRDAFFLLGTATVSWILAHFLKNIVAHPRPDLEGALIMPNDPYSFPSGHASFMFALAFAMNYFSWTAGIMLAVFALITGMARILAGVHYTYDIIGGAVLGYLVSQAGIYFYKKFFKKG